MAAVDGPTTLERGRRASVALERPSKPEAGEGSWSGWSQGHRSSRQRSREDCEPAAKSERLEHDEGREPARAFDRPMLRTDNTLEAMRALLTPREQATGLGGHNTAASNRTCRGYEGLSVVHNSA